jgi:hypothetical protein
MSSSTRFERRHAITRSRQQSRQKRRDKAEQGKKPQDPGNGVSIRHVDPEREAELVVEPPAEADAEASTEATPLPPAAEVIEQTEQAQKIAELESRVVSQQQQIEKWRSMQTKSHCPPGFSIVEVKHDATRDNRGDTNKDGSPKSIGRVIRYATKHDESDWVSGEHLDPAGAVKTAWERHLEMSVESRDQKISALEAKLKKARTKGSRSKDA